MTKHFGEVPSGAVLPVFFATYDKTNGYSITQTGLAVTDIEIYKNGSVTQRASDAGYTLLDTDGIDFDGTTGIHGFSIDTGDNTDSGFFSVGAFFDVVVSSITVDGGTVNFLAASFRIRAAEHTAGYPVSTIKDGTGTGELDTASGVVLAKDHTGANLATASALDAVDNFVDTEIAALVSDVAAVKAKTDNLPSDPADASVVAGLIAAVETKVDTIDDFLDLEIAAILADTNELQTDWANGGRLDLILDARASQTSVDDLPTNAELATALGTADDAVLAAVANVQSDTNDIQTRLPAALTADGNIKADALRLAGSATAAEALRQGGLALVTSTCAAGSTTTSIVTNLTESTDDHYNGRIISFTSGALLGQSTDITDYNGTTKTITCTALTEAPADTDGFLIS